MTYLIDVLLTTKSKWFWKWNGTPFMAMHTWWIYMLNSLVGTLLLWNSFKPEDACYCNSVTHSHYDVRRNIAMRCSIFCPRVTPGFPWLPGCVPAIINDPVSVVVPPALRTLDAVVSLVYSSTYVHGNTSFQHLLVWYLCFIVLSVFVLLYFINF